MNDKDCSKLEQQKKNKTPVEAVAWLITWNSGRKSVSFDKCHPDDGTCAPLTHPAPVAHSPAGVDDAMAARLRDALPFGCAGFVSIESAKYAIATALKPAAGPEGRGNE